MRRAFMADVLGIQLKPEVLPLSNLAAPVLAVSWPGDALLLTAGRAGPRPPGQ